MSSIIKSSHLSQGDPLVKFSQMRQINVLNHKSSQLIRLSLENLVAVVLVDDVLAPNCFFPFSLSFLSFVCLLLSLQAVFMFLFSAGTTACISGFCLLKCCNALMKSEVQPSEHSHVKSSQIWSMHTAVKSNKLQEKSKKKEKKFSLMLQMHTIC